MARPSMGSSDVVRLLEMFVKPMSVLSFSEKGLEPKTSDLEIDYEVGVLFGAVLVFSLEK